MDMSEALLQNIINFEGKKKGSVWNNLEMVECAHFLVICTTLCDRKLKLI